MQKLADWMEEYPTNLSLDISRELAISHAHQGGTVGEQIALLIRSDKIRAVCEFALPSFDDPVWSASEASQEAEEAEDDRAFSGDTETATEQRGRVTKNVSDEAVPSAASKIYHCRQAIAFFQKIENLEIGIDRKAVAFDKFCEAEELCWETNTFFKDVRRGAISISPRASSILYSAQRKISRILGKVPLLGMLDLRFGPGATRGVKRNQANARSKLDEQPGCSEDLIGMASSLLAEMPHLTGLHQTGGPSGGRLELYDGFYEEWASVDVQIQTSKLSFVPKNYKTFRSICVEPTLNTMYQAGLGRYMATRLKKFGFDIKDQGRNKYLAKLGSLTGALATLDLSMASDTVSLELCAELLPPDWFEVLRRARTAHVLCKDPVTNRSYIIRQEKFSSMGNGFTFPLETLIFGVLAQAATESVGLTTENVSAYGDDIIVPTAAYEVTTEILRICGFVVNLSKSYSTGFFRESCGADWYRGIDVRPFQAKAWWSPRTLFVLHNYYVRRGDTERAEKVELMIHPALRIYGPDGFGDGHLLGEHLKRRKARQHRDGYAGYLFDTFQLVSDTDTVQSAGSSVVPHYSIYQRGSVESRLNLDGSSGSHARSAVLAGIGRGIGSVGESPLPLKDNSEGGKILGLPGNSGYKRVSIYTLG